MSNESSSSQVDRTETYLRTWAASACDVLGKIAGAAFTTVELTADELTQAVESLKEQAVWLRFTVEKAIKGEQSLGVRRSDALRLAKILMGEPPDEGGEFNSDYQDALAELFRQFAGTAAVAVKPQVGGEVNLQLVGNDAGGWKPGRQWAIGLKSEGTPQFPLVILLDPNLCASLAPAPATTSAHPPSATKPAPIASPASSKANRNIDLLLDVELPVTLRFGKCEMTLGNILELSAGAVVELEQRIMEPVELLVGGKRVAQGEVVVMDGHYALRVTEVLNPMERLESLAA